MYFPALIVRVIFCTALYIVFRIMVFYIYRSGKIGKGKRFSSNDNRRHQCLNLYSCNRVKEFISIIFIVYSG